MKTKRMILLVGILLATTTMFAQSKKTEDIKVYGACGMCDTRIEKTVNAMPGVVSSEWTKDTQMLKVTYKAKKVKSLDIHKALAKVGHDTDLERADDKVYAALPGCCHYDRPEVKKKK